MTTPTHTTSLWTRQPRRSETHVMWRVGLVMYTAAAVTILAVLPAPDPDTSDHPALLVVASVATLIAVIQWLVGPRLFLVWTLPFVGIALVSVVIAIAKPVGITPIFYLWPVMAAAYFLPRRGVVAALAFFVATYAAGLAFAEPLLRVVMFTGGVMSIGLTGALVHLLKERLDRVVSDLEVSASTDPLTGVLNRRAFEEQFDRELRRAARMGEELAIALFDLDFFKRVNDRFGHARGDDVLRLFAGVLREHRREHDHLARLGGEEFAVLLVGANAEGARQYAERVNAALQEAAPADIDELTVSAGVAALGADHGTREELIRAADAALYAAKASGRARVAVSG